MKDALLPTSIGESVERSILAASMIPSIRLRFTVSDEFGLTSA